MNRPDDDEYGSLSDLLGDSPYDDAREDSDPDEDSDEGEDPDRGENPGPGEPDDTAGDPSGGLAGDSPDGSADSSADSLADAPVDASAEAPVDASAEAPVDAPESDDPWVDLPAGMPAEYAEAFRRGYERARRGEDLTDDTMSSSQPGSAAGWQEPEPDEVTVAPGEPWAEPDDVEPTVAVDRPESREPEPDVPWQEPEPDEATVAPGETGAGRDDVEPTVRIDRGALGGAAPSQAAPSQAAPSQAAPSQAAPSQAPPGAGPPEAGAFQPAPQPSPWFDDAPTQSVPVQKEGPSWQASARSVLDKAVGPAEGRDPRVLAAVLGVLALVVLVLAFGLGRLFADDGTEPRRDAGSGDTQAGTSQEIYQGAVKPVPVKAARATCQTGSSTDAAGNPVSYEPAKAYDADLTTAWRCNGSGKGQRLVLTLPPGTVVAQLGLVPGYAKTDPASGVDRYAENNRITKVRWRLDDGTSFVQKMSGAPGNRRMRLMRIPETSSGRVVLQILASRPGPRNTVAVSEIRIAAPQG